MTQFEESLLAASITISHDTDKMIGGILELVQSENVGHAGDKFNTIIAKAIIDHIESLSHEETDKKELHEIFSEKIFPQLMEGNYTGIIAEINALEDKYKKNTEENKN